MITSKENYTIYYFINKKIIKYIKKLINKNNLNLISYIIRDVEIC